MNDILVTYWEDTHDVAQIVAEKLHKLGYIVDLVIGDKLRNSATEYHAAVNVLIVAGSCAKDCPICGGFVIPVWPNNTARPVGLSAEISTLDMVGTDFELSFGKVCQRLPASLREKSAAVRKLMSEGMWVEFLDQYPELSDLCPYDSLSGYQWAELLPKHPELAERCDWNKLHGGHWLSLLRANPLYAKYCRWEMLSSEDWRDLLKEHPEFAVKRSVDKSNCEHRRQFKELCAKELVLDCKDAPSDVDVEASEDDVDRDFLYDIYIASNSTGRVAAARLMSALELRGYSVYAGDGDATLEENFAAIVSAQYFILIRSERVFDDLLNRKSNISLWVAQALRCGKRMISVGPMDQRWQDSRSLPENFRTLETDQVKPLDMGDLFEEKVDALIRESMRSMRGSLAKKYDVFISYRRSTGDKVARRVHQLLREYGFLSFLDYDCILNGKYDKVIRSALDSAPVFIPILTDGSLDRCKNPGDWVAEEIRMAIRAGKCVIPVAPDNQQWSIPNDLPVDLAAIRSLPVSALSMSNGLAARSMAQIVEKFPDEVKDKGDLIRDIRERGGCQDEDNCILEEDGAVPAIQISPDGKRVFNSELSGLLWRYPDAISLFSYRDFDTDTWCGILEDVPELCSFCDLNLLGDFEWSRILSKQPQLKSLRRSETRKD